MSPFAVFAEDERAAGVPSAGTTLSHAPSFFDRYGDPHSARTVSLLAVRLRLALFAENVAHGIYILRIRPQSSRGSLPLNLVVARKPKTAHSLLWLAAIKRLERI